MTNAPPATHPSPSGFDPEAAAAELAGRLADVGDPVRAVNEQRYLKSTRPFMGCRVPVVRTVARQVMRERGLLGARGRVNPERRQEVLDLAATLWSHPTYEVHRAGVEVLVAARGLCTPDDLPLLEGWLRDGETWAVVDDLAIRVVGSVVERHANDPGVGATLDRWAEDPDSFWVRRAAMLCLIGPLRAGGGDWDRFCRYADARLHEREFFIRKAIGWVLRETSHKRPDLVRGWVEPRLDAMSGVTRREALKYL